MHILCVYFPSRAVRFPQISKVGLLHAEFLLCSSGEYLGAKTGVYSKIPNCRLGRNHLPQVLASICSEVKLMRAPFESLMTIPLTATFSC